MCVKAQNPVMGLLKGVLTSTASATISSIYIIISTCNEPGAHGLWPYLLELVQLVLALGVLRGADGHAGKQATDGLHAC